MWVYEWGILTLGLSETSTYLDFSFLQNSCYYSILAITYIFQFVNTYKTLITKGQGEKWINSICSESKLFVYYCRTVRELQFSITSVSTTDLKNKTYEKPP